MAVPSSAQLGSVILLLASAFGSTEAFELNFDTTEGILAIVGIAVGGLAIIVIVICCCCYCSKSSDKKRPPPQAGPVPVANSASSDKSHVIASAQFTPNYAPNNATQLSSSSAQRASSPPLQQSNVPNRGSQVPVSQMQPLSIATANAGQYQHPPTPTPITPQPQHTQSPITSPLPQQQQMNRTSYIQQPGPSGMSSMPQSPRTPTPASPPLENAQPVQRGPSFLAANPMLERNQERASGRLPKSIYKNPFGFPEDNFEDLLIVELKTKLPPKQPYLGQNYSVNSEPVHHQRESWQHDERMRSRSPGPPDSYSPSLPRVQIHPNQVQTGYVSEDY